jgi:catechol 2,3-dioxygenase-like lactoylglutathione lyase family enzyme
MEQRVSIITLGVADLKRSREFYQRLGWRRSMAKAEGVVFFQTGGMALALYPREELAKDANVANVRTGGDGFGGITVAYNTRNRAEVDSVLKEAEAAGAKDTQACPGSILGRLFGLLLGSRRISVGGRLESILSDDGKRKHSDS